MNMFVKLYVYVQSSNIILFECAGVLASQTCAFLWIRLNLLLILCSEPPNTIVLIIFQMS